MFNCITCEVKLKDKDVVFVILRHISNIRFIELCFIAFISKYECVEIFLVNYCKKCYLKYLKNIYKECIVVSIVEYKNFKN